MEGIEDLGNPVNNAQAGGEWEEGMRGLLMNLPVLSINVPSGMPRDELQRIAQEELLSFRGRGGGRGNHGAGGGGAAGGGGGGNGDNDPFKDVTLASVKGLDDQISWLKNTIVDPLMDPAIKEVWGRNPPKGVLMYGPPGTGKTLLARAFGNEISSLLKRPVTFMNRKGGDLLSKWFGESGRLIREMFQEAKLKAPSIIFLDELDGVCPSRDSPTASQANSSVVTALLGEMDAIVPGEVFVFAATNRLDAVDPAMKRPGRFDAHLQFQLPTLEARKEMVSLYTTKWRGPAQPTEAKKNAIAQRTAGFSGADMENVCREAFFHAYKRHIPDLDDPNASLSNMLILEEDWDAALANVKPSTTTAYGYAMHIPRLPEAAVNPLVDRIQNEMLKEVVVNLPPYRLSTTALNRDNLITPAEVHTMYIWDKDPHSLHHYILPGLLSRKELSSYPIFELQRAQVPSNVERMRMVKKVIGLAAECPDPCILFVPNLEEVVSEVEEDFYKEILNIRGTHTLLLATGDQEPAFISHPQIRYIINGVGKATFGVPSLNVHDKRKFFAPLLQEAKKKRGGGSEADWKAFEKQLETETTGDGMEPLVKLRDLFARKIAAHEEGTAGMLLRLKAVFSHYKKTKLHI